MCCKLLSASCLVLERQPGSEEFPIPRAKSQASLKQPVLRFGDFTFAGGRLQLFQEELRPVGEGRQSCHGLLSLKRPQHHRSQDPGVMLKLSRGPCSA